MKNIIIILTILTLAACAPKQDNTQEQEIYNNSPVLAYVDNKPITQEDFDKAANNLDDGFKKFVNTKSGRANFLSFLISEKLLLTDAVNRKLDKTPEYQQEITALEEAQKNALETAKNFALRRLLLETLTQDGTLGVSEEEIKNYYKKYPYEITIRQLIISDPDFKGYIHDIGGATANFYHPACEKQLKHGSCKNRQCLYPQPCKNLNADHSRYLNVLKRVRNLPGIKKVFIRSGVRFDYMLCDKDDSFLDELCAEHISGQLRVAPEHITDNV